MIDGTGHRPHENGSLRLAEAERSSAPPTRGPVGRPVSLAVLVAALGVVGAASVAACSSTESAGPSDAGDDAAVAASPPQESSDAGATDAAACAPRALETKPRWVPPTPWRQSACTKAQVAEVISSCFHGTGATCDAYRAQNAACFRCMVSVETEATWGPLVLYANSTLSELNYAGCMANAFADTSGDGCGAAAGRLNDCGHLACRGCLSDGAAADPAAFKKCTGQRELADLCAAEVASFNAKCAGYKEIAAVCFAPQTSDDGYLEAYLDLWCTPDADGGADAGDAGDADGGADGGL